MPRKSISVYTELASATKIECKAGNHTFVIDQPSDGGGKDLGPTPLQYYLVSIAGCICSIARIVATQKKIKLNGIKISTEGEINTDVLLGRNSEERPGFQSIALQISIDADLSDAEKIEFINEVERRCPVSENTTNPTTVTLKIVQ